jgi:hypothetical protein
MLALSADGNVGTDWRRGRVAEGTSLLRMHTAYTCIVGSNPTVSARKKQKAPARELFPLTPPGDEGAICMAPAWDSKGCPYLGSPLRITVSARKKQKAPARELFPLTLAGDEGAICMAPAWDSKGCPYLAALSESSICCAQRAQRSAPWARFPFTLLQ